MISNPQQPNNLGSALSMWNQFMAPQAPGPSAPPPGTSVDPATGQYRAPQGNNYPGQQDPSASLMPKTQSWNGSDPWFTGQQPNANGTVTNPDSSANAGKAVGAATGLSGLLGSI